MNSSRNSPNPPADGKPRLSSREAAAYLNVSPDVLKKLRHQRRIPFYRFGHRTVVYERADLDLLLQELQIKKVTYNGFR